MTDKIGKSRDELLGCPFCGAKPVNCGGYDYHKVACYGSFCPISGVSMSVDKWQSQQAAGVEPVYVIVNRERFSPKEEFVEIENSAGESVRIPSTPDAGGRRIGPLYASPRPPKAVPDCLFNPGECATYCKCDDQEAPDE